MLEILLASHASEAILSGSIKCYFHAKFHPNPSLAHDLARTFLFRTVSEEWSAFSFHHCLLIAAVGKEEGR